MCDETRAVASPADRETWPADGMESSGDNPQVCKSLVYDCQTRTCKIFCDDDAHNGRLTVDSKSIYLRFVNSVFAIETLRVILMLSEYIRVVQLQKRKFTMPFSCFSELQATCMAKTALTLGAHLQVSLVNCILTF
jgi:hypothetical protein